jgi:O-antigen ligase
MFADYPILGVGFSSFSEFIETTSGRYERFHKGEPSVTLPHNVFMSLLAETGIVGIMCFAFFLWQAVRSCFWLSKHHHHVERREYAIFALSAVAAYVMQGMSLHPISSIDFPNYYLFIFLGVLSGLVDASKIKPSRSACST